MPSRLPFRAITINLKLCRPGLRRLLFGIRLDGQVHWSFSLAALRRSFLLGESGLRLEKELRVGARLEGKLAH